VLARCSAADIDKVASWLHENWTTPFPVGTLLWYRLLETDDTDLASLSEAAKHQPQSRDEALP